MRDKDQSIAVARALGIEFKLLSIASTGYLGNGLELFLDIFKAVRETRKEKIDLWVTKFGAGNIAAKLLGRGSISFNDDDVDVVPLIGATSYLFADKVLVTSVTRMGKYSAKAVRYPSCHELFYLHPARFSPDPSIREELGVRKDERFGIVRLSGLAAHHDVGKKGIEKDWLVSVLEEFAGDVRFFISSERPLPAELEPHRIMIRPERIHHALAFADVFLGDSQTMTSEAAVLGTPALRLSDFVGRLSVISELEDYGLAFGFLPGEEEGVLSLLRAVFRDQVFREQLAASRKRYLADKIDPAPWFAKEVMKSLYD